MVRSQSTMTGEVACEVACVQSVSSQPVRTWELAHTDTEAVNYQVQSDRQRLRTPSMSECSVAKISWTASSEVRPDQSSDRNPSPTDVVELQAPPPKAFSRSSSLIPTCTQAPEGQVIHEQIERASDPLTPTTYNVVAIYDEIVHWKKSFFSIPNNAVGKAFVNELSSTLQNYVDSKGSDGKALYTFAVLPALLLQKPMPSCGYKDATQHLRRRLDLWAKQYLCWKRGDVSKSSSR